MRDPGLRALVIDARVPVTGRDAGSQAILSHMRGLQTLGYTVTFAAAEEMSPPNENIAALAVSGIACCSKPFYASIEDVLRRQEGCFDVVYLHRADIASSYLTLARRCNPKARILYSVADLHHVRLQRQSIVEDRPELLAASHRMQLIEFTAALSADAVLTHSLDEAALLHRALPQANVRHVPWDVPTRRPNVPFVARNGVAFIGDYGHPPNVDAAHWLVEAVMPLVWQIDPAIECVLVGSDMLASVRNLAGPRVVVAGQVADLGTAVFDRVRLTVAPLRYGAGVKGKVLESFAAGVPCVMTEVAAEGLDLSAVMRAMVGGTAADLARIIARAHASEDLSDKVGTAGLAWVGASFTADAIACALGNALGHHLPAATAGTLQMAVGD